MQPLRGKPWVVYAKPPLAGPAELLDYVSRYTRRTAIFNECLLGILRNDVHLRTRSNREHLRGGADDGCARTRVIKLGGAHFMRMRPAKSS